MRDDVLSIKMWVTSDSWIKNIYPEAKRKEKCTSKLVEMRPTSARRLSLCVRQKTCLAKDINQLKEKKIQNYLQCYFGSSGLAVSILRSMQTEKLQRKPNKKSRKIWWLTKQHFLFSKFSFWKRLFVKSHLSQPGTFLSDSFIQFFYKSLCRFPFIIYECKLWKLFLNTRCTTTVQRPNFLPQWSCLFS